MDNTLGLVLNINSKHSEVEREIYSQKRLFTQEL